MEFVQTGMKWVVEFQSAAQGLVTVEVPDKKHQVSGRNDRRVLSTTWLELMAEYITN